MSTALPPRALPHLVVLVGPDVGRSYRIAEAETVIGRSTEAGMTLLSSSVSRRHALLRMTGDKLTVEDLGSKNGTFVGVEKIKGSVELADRDEITIGDLILLHLRHSIAFEGVLHEAGYATGSQDPLTGLASLPCSHEWRPAATEPR